MRALTVGKKVGTKNPLQPGGAGDRSCGLPSCFSLPGPCLGKLYNKRARKVVQCSMQNMPCWPQRHRIISPQVHSSRLLYPSGFSMMLLVHDDPEHTRMTEPVLSRRHRTPAAVFTWELSTLHFLPSQVTVASQCAGSVC